jgi:hypothetical protein
MARVPSMAAVALLVATGALAATPIGDIVKNPDGYKDQSVTIEGTVTGLSLGYLSDAMYTLQGSDDYRVTVVGRGARPDPGTKLLVTGTVRRKPPDEEFDFPPVVQETSRTTE